MADSPFKFDPSVWAGMQQAGLQYAIDAVERSVLFLDTLREREAQQTEEADKVAPHVLRFKFELVADGRTLARPVNYMLVKIVPSAGQVIDDRKRPFVVIDPRAGHGPGIGGFKAQSEIGVILNAGHPCYFVGFLPEPVPGQTIEDIIHAEAQFLTRVAKAHPKAEGKPAVIGNCQAGWAAMLLAASNPDLPGPLILAGSPLSYWAGVRGENPMRYTGGLLGGTWLTAMMGDLGNGRFDGAWLVSNFENLNPSNTYWTKQYNLYSNIDTERPRYLEFERWWGAHVQLNAEEMQYIADELFVGNKLAAGTLALSDGRRVDLRAIKSPIVVFCSKADNITPPQQALGWILDLYDSVQDLRAHGQTIVYAVHESVGHLGIFVSGSVASKEHDEFASNIDLIDVLPPGLYEAVMLPKRGDQPGDNIEGEYLVRFESRTLDDIRALGGNDEQDDREFAAAARVSEINLALYRATWQAAIKPWVNEGNAELLRKFHPLRLGQMMFSDWNPWAKMVEEIAPMVKANRHPVAPDNPWWQAQEHFSQLMRTSLDAYRDSRDRYFEFAFHSVYGLPWFQAMLGIDPAKPARAKAERDPKYLAAVARRIKELRSRISTGGPREALIRALIYVRMPDGVVDERGFNLLRSMRQEVGDGVSLSEFKAIVREQFLTLIIDEKSAVSAIPAMLARNPRMASELSVGLDRLVDSIGLGSAASKSRYREIEAMLAAVLDKPRAAERPQDQVRH